MNTKQQVLTLFPLDKDKGYICECCQQYVRRYSRSFNSNMAIALIEMYKHRDRGFIHVETFMANLGYKRCGDFSYLRHYRLIEAKKEDRVDGSNRNGFYKITGVGILFVEQKMKVQAKFKIFNNKCEGFEGAEISINDALGKKYDYNEIMYGIAGNSHNI